MKPPEEMAVGHCMPGGRASGSLRNLAQIESCHSEATGRGICFVPTMNSRFLAPLGMTSFEIVILKRVLRAVLAPLGPALTPFRDPRRLRVHHPPTLRTGNKGHFVSG
jgi:hypothetical protein